MIFICGCGGDRGRLDASANLETKPPATARIEGKVSLGDRADSSGIQVFVPGSSLMAMTDAQGNYVITGLTAGRYLVMAQREGYESVQLGGVEVGRLMATQRYLLPPRVIYRPAPAPPTPVPIAFGAINGRVRLEWEGDEEAAIDLSGVLVELEGTSMRTFTDAEGSFYLWNLEPGAYRLAARKEGYTSDLREVDVSAGEEPTEVELALAPMASRLTRREITGTVRVLSADGTPIEGSSAVRLNLLELPSFRVVIDEEGYFRIGPLAADLYTLQAFGEGLESVEDQIVDLRETLSAEVTVTMRAAVETPDEPGSVAGVILKDVEGITDMSGVAVGLAGTSFVAMSDSEGRFLLGDVPVGMYELLGQAEGFETLIVEGVEVLPGEELILDDIYLQPVLDYPVVLRSDPPEGTTDFLLRYAMALRIRFNKKMDPDSLRASVSISPDVDFQVFAGNEHRETDFDLMLVLIDGGSTRKPVRYDTPFRMTIATTAEDFEGLRMEEPFVLNFRTGKPSVMDTFPPDGASEVTLDPSEPLIVRFNASLDPRSVIARQIRIRPSVGSVPTVQLIDDPATGWTELHIQSAWKQGTRYEVTVPRGIRTRTRQRLANTPYTFAFTTSELSELPALGSPPR